MDIGTAKPGLKERRLVSHHMLDLIEPNERFTAAAFKQRAQACIKEITARGKLPIMVGGTGLYIDAVLFDFEFQGPADPELRQRLQALTVTELQGILQSRDTPLPANERNPRHLIRRIEAGSAPREKRDLRPKTLVIGVDVDPEVLKTRIKTRVRTMVDAGLESEVGKLAKRYDFGCFGLQTIGYREFEAYFKGVQSLHETEAAIVKDTIAYAKRQRTWFARNKSIHWVAEQLDIEDLITTFLSK
jgi:tRNA dimethylallyltransferase